MLVIILVNDLESELSRKIISLLLFLLLLRSSLSFEPIKPLPEKVPYNKEKAELGKILFHDPILSKDRTVSCSTCHELYKKWGTDRRPVSVGIEGKHGNANAPTVFNTYFNFRLFWNGRAKNLKEQAKGPLHNPVEMAMDKNEIEKRLNKNPFYKKMFKKIYKTDTVKYEQVLDAIAEFEKALITPNSKFDKYLRCKEKHVENPDRCNSILTEKELKGYLIFKKVGCITCHNGINVGGNSFQKLGVINAYIWKPTNPDRYQITKKEKDKNVYRVPSLRNVACTYPYFHDGSVKTLKEALKKMSYHNLGFELTEKEIDYIEAFLKTLTGELPPILRESEHNEK